MELEFQYYYFTEQVDFNYNYIQTGWINLSENGFQVIGIDFRGYGESDKSNDSNFYGTTNLANDVINLIDHLKLENIGLIGLFNGYGDCS
jgi:pimeloyl-ACP methyl ester carboxylesterase